MTVLATCSSRATLALAATGLCLVAIGCAPSTSASVSVSEWCTRLELALRDRDALCECPVEPAADEVIEARCAALDASSLEEAIDTGAVGWNGAVAAAIVARVTRCDRSLDETLTDDPVIGAAGPGEPCRTFDDVARHPDDCAYGARCAAPIGGDVARCVELVSAGEACDAARACERGLVCGGDGTCAEEALRPGDDAAACTSESDCRSALCVDGGCVGPFALGASCERAPAWGIVDGCDACPDGCTAAGTCVELCADGACRDGTCITATCAAPR